MVKLLQKSAVEHLTTYRQFEARDFDSVVTIVTTDYEALYAYKRGDYQRCLQLSTQNVHTLLDAVRMPNVMLLPDFIQLFDDEIVSVTALAVIVVPESRKCKSEHCYISQLTLSLYLMTQCQLKLGHSVKALAQTFRYVKIAGGKITYSENCGIDRLMLKLSERKILTYLLSPVC